MSDVYYESVKRQMATQLDASHDKEGVFWAVIEGITSCTGDASALASSGLQLLRDAIGHNSSGSALVPNPWFIANGHDDGPISYTTKYLRNRGRKGLAGGAVGIVGSVSSQVTQVDVAGILQHGNATGSSAVHLVNLKSMAGRHRKTGTIRGWLDVMIRCKQMKIGIRGTQFVGAAIPVGATGPVTGIIAAAGKIGVNLTYSKLSAAASAEMHWRAYQEQAISGGGVNVGPATRMLYELFAKRGFTRIFGKYDVNQIIREPTGWLAINDKLMLM
jgi:hypothetical protein